MPLLAWNATMAILQFAMGSVLAWLYADKKLLDKPIPLTTLRASKFPSGDTFSIKFIQSDANQIYLAQETIAFFFVTGIFHSIYAGTHNTMYQTLISNNNNMLRWLEYSISATLMMRIISLQCGIRDRDTIDLITTTMISVMLMGQIVETSIASPKGAKGMDPNQKIIAIVATIVGWILMLGVFAMVIRKFVELQDDVSNFKCPNVEIPKFVLAIIVTQLIFYSTFGFIQLYHVWQRIYDKPVDYEFIEKLYIIDSLVAKLTLGGILAYSVVASDTGVYGTFKCP